MKMSTFAAAIATAAASAGSVTATLTAASTSTSTSSSSMIIISALRRTNMRGLVDTAKRRTLNGRGWENNSSNFIGCGSNHHHFRRWNGLAFASTSHHTSISLALPSSRYFSNDRYQGGVLPWTPICEDRTSLSASSKSSLRMAPPNFDTEGFRDAIRGSQDYIKPKDPADNSEQQQQQQQRQQQQPNQNQPAQQGQQGQPKSIPFPKLTPGRQRNYRPPHVVSAMRANDDLKERPISFGSQTSFGGSQTSFGSQSSFGENPARAISDAEKDFCDALNPEDRYHCVENFRDGRESAQYIKVKGGEAARVVEQLPQNDVGAVEEPTQVLIPEDDAVNGDDVLDSPPKFEEEDFSDELLDTGSFSENFRDGPQTKASRSGSDVAVTMDDILSESSTPEDNPLKTKSFFDNIGPSSMHFRDGGHMSQFKDKSFSSLDSSKTPIADLLEGRDRQMDAEELAYEELLGGGGDTLKENSIDVTEGYLQASLLQDIFDEGEDESVLLQEIFDEDDSMLLADEEPVVEDEEPASTSSTRASAILSGHEPTPDEAASAKTAKSTSLLSIDPMSINIIPLKKAKVAEEGTPDDEKNDLKSSFMDPIPHKSVPLSSKWDNWNGLASSGNFVKMFRGSASYIANHRGTLAVYHIPGELLAWEGFPGLMDDIALTWLLGMKIVLVAGCRHQIDMRLEDEEGNDEDGNGLGGRVMMSSIRVTDEETLRVVKEEAGFVRFEIERRLAKSLRLHGGLVKGSESLVGNVVSGNFYSAQPFGVVDGIDYCWTGFPRKVEIERIRQVHETNDIVLLTSLGVSPSGEIFNVNSEYLAASVAGAMSASKIIYFNVHGTSFQNKHTEKPVQNLRVSDAKNLLKHYKMRIHPKGFALVDLDGDSPQQSVLRTPGSMETLIKVGYSMVALEKGVKRAHILAPENGALVQELYTRDGCGTLISRDIYEGIRRGDVNDVSGIYDLIDPLVKSGTLVERPKSKLEKEILSYYVYTRDGLVVATGQLKRFEGGFAEIGCLVVSSDYRRGGRGDAMLGYLERLSLQCGAKKVFVLSTQTMEWFVERGFLEVPVESLPPSRQALYNKKRNSKIYMKEIDGDRDLDAAELWWSNK